jgi:hypothetical protein
MRWNSAAVGRSGCSIAAMSSSALPIAAPNTATRAARFVPGRDHFLAIHHASDSASRRNGNTPSPAGGGGGGGGPRTTGSCAVMIGSIATIQATSTDMTVHRAAPY